MSFQDDLDQGRRGDVVALDTLFGRWRLLLRLQARKLLGAELSARLDPSDVVQEALAQAFTDLAQFRGQSEGEWVNWLHRIVAGHAAKARRHHTGLGRDIGVEEAAAAAPIDSAADPAGQALQHEEAARAAAAVENLPEPYREVVVRRVFCGEPFDEVARAMQRTPGSARVLWTRALRLLRASLQTDDAGGL